MSFLCRSCGVLINDSEAALHHGHDLLEQSTTSRWYRCATIGCLWNGPDARAHWRRQTEHTEYTHTLRVAKMVEELPAGGRVGNPVLYLQRRAMGLLGKPPVEPSLPAAAFVELAYLSPELVPVLAQDNALAAVMRSLPLVAKFLPKDLTPPPA